MARMACEAVETAWPDHILHRALVARLVGRTTGTSTLFAYSYWTHLWPAWFCWTGINLGVYLDASPSQYQQSCTHSRFGSAQWFRRRINLRTSQWPASQAGYRKRI